MHTGLTPQPARHAVVARALLTDRLAPGGVAVAHTARESGCCPDGRRPEEAARITSAMCASYGGCPQALPALVLVHLQTAPLFWLP